MGSITRDGGIYAIRGPNGGVYVGSAVKFSKRWVFHKSLLKRGIHHSPHLQHAWDKYGPDCLMFEVLEWVDDMDRLYDIEQGWLDALFRVVPRHRIYNVTRSADGATGRKPSAETLAKLSAVRKGRKKSDETRRRMSEGRKGMKFEAGHVQNIALGKSGGKVYTILAPDGTRYHDVVNLRAFAEQHELSRSGLANVASGRAVSHKGWYLWNQSTDEPISFPERRRDGRNDEERDRLAFNRSGGKRYTITAPDGIQYSDVVNVARFARSHGLRPAGLAKVACGETKAYKGWTLHLQPM